MSNANPETPWTAQHASAFRAYLKNSNSELFSQLAQLSPPALTRDQLLTMPSDSIARQQLLIEGFNMAVEVLHNLRHDPVRESNDEN